MNQYATLGGGCFWCTEAIFSEVEGVDSVVSGYAGGTTPNPSYQSVCTGTTQHAEVIQLSYDKSKIAYADLLRIHLTTHDPTTLNRQGADVGTQYRSIILTHSDEQQTIASDIIQELATFYEHKIVTEVTPCIKFYPAEIAHQTYYKLNSSEPYCKAVINPKLAKLRQQFSSRLRNLK